MNLFELITTKDNWIVHNRKEGSQVNIIHLYFMREPSTVEPFYIDEFMIGRSQVSGMY